MGKIKKDFYRAVFVHGVGELTCFYYKLPPVPMNNVDNPFRGFPSTSRFCPKDHGHNFFLRKKNYLMYIFERQRNEKVEFGMSTF